MVQRLEAERPTHTINSSHLPNENMPILASPTQKSNQQNNLYVMERFPSSVVSPGPSPADELKFINGYQGKLSKHLEMLDIIPSLYHRTLPETSDEIDPNTCEFCSFHSENKVEMEAHREKHRWNSKEKKLGIYNTL